MRPVVGGPVFAGVVRSRMRPGAVGHPLDQRRPVVAARALRRPMRGRIHRQEVVAIHPQRGDTAADAARRKGGALAAGNRLKGGDRPLVVHHVQDHRRAVDVGEGQRGVEIGLGGGPVADPGRRNLRVALDRRRHGPAHRLDELRGQVARDREKAGVAHRIHHRQLPALERVVRVGHELADQPHQRHLARHQQALLAVGGKTHVAPGQRQRVRRTDGLLPDALHVERQLLLPLGDQHARVEHPRLEHGAQAAAQQVRRQLRRPGADGLPLVVEHAHQVEGQVAGLRRLDVQRRATGRAGRRQMQVSEIGLMAGSGRGLRHVQAQGLMGFHGQVSSQRQAQAWH
jgi:hypothetical protein